MEGIRMTVGRRRLRNLEMSPMALRIALRQQKFSQFGQAWKNDRKWRLLHKETDLNMRDRELYIGTHKGITIIQALLITGIWTSIRLVM